ncbi:prohead protease/major capsid protein fusion protein [Roseomonas chloroacetimidivorans]|uniref:prohead protease/major capsid protein fusion protein n=1 Tax=Roseomonas chloroacetimidivorans TaxID=1766656 RepID=UPI003C726319
MTETAVPGPTPSAPVVAARALTAPASVNQEARTVDVIWSTGARANNTVMPLGCITEELEMSPNAVRMGRLQSGAAPVLDSHSRWGARDVLGVVAAARLEGGRGVATLRFSTASDVEPVWQRIVDGTLRSVSVGYRVFKYEVEKDPSGSGEIHRAVDWEPYEISLVAVPVDAAAGVRGEGAQAAIAPAVEPAITTSPIKDQTMPDKTKPAAPAGGAEAPVAPVQAPAPAAPATPAAPAVPPAQSPEPTAPPPSLPPNQNPDATRAAKEAAMDAVRMERDRISGLHGAADASRSLLSPEQINPLLQQAINEGWTAEALRGRLFDELLKSTPRPSTPAAPVTGPSNGDPALMLDAMADALAVRSMPGFEPKSARHSEYAGWRPSQMVEELLRARGERNVPRDTVNLAARAFHTTSDFPALLGSAANKMLLAAYQPVAPSYRQVMMRRDFRDFKPHRALRVGDFPNLLELPEGSEIKSGTIGESQELVYLRTFARNVRVTRQMLVNDDLGAFTDFAAMIGRRVADFENMEAYRLINTDSGNGPALSANGAVFGTGNARKNKAASGTVLDLPNLGAARAAVMVQKTIDGTPISVGQQMILLVGPAQELAALQLTTATTPTQGSNVNPYAAFTRVVVDANIVGNRWYLFADPNSAPVFVYGFLNGAEGPQIRTERVSGHDGVQVEVIHDFGVGAIDFRGGYFNPGT